MEGIMVLFSQFQFYLALSCDEKVEKRVIIRHQSPLRELSVGLLN